MSGYGNPAIELGYQNYAEQMGAQYGLPSGLMSSVIQNESNWNGSAVNAASGATGIMQFLPSTAANPGYGVAPFDPTDPFASMQAGAQYLAAVQQQTGSLASALNQFSGGAPYASSLAQQYGASGTGSGSPSGASAVSGSSGSSIGHYVKVAAFLVLAVVIIAAGIFFLRKKS